MMETNAFKEWKLTKFGYELLSYWSRLLLLTLLRSTRIIFSIFSKKGEVFPCLFFCWTRELLASHLFFIKNYINFMFFQKSSFDQSDSGKSCINSDSFLLTFSSSYYYSCCCCCYLWFDQNISNILCISLLLIVLCYFYLFLYFAVNFAIVVCCLIEGEGFFIIVFFVFLLYFIRVRI